MSIVKDSRHHPRADIFAQVQVTRASDVYIMSTMNMSQGGVFIQGNPAEYPDLQVGVEVEVVFFVAQDVGNEDVSLNAKIVRIESGSVLGRIPGFGLQFLAVDSIQASRLDHLIKASQYIG